VADHFQRVAGEAHIAVVGADLVKVVADAQLDGDGLALELVLRAATQIELAASVDSRWVLAARAADGGDGLANLVATKSEANAHDATQARAGGGCCGLGLRAQGQDRSQADQNLLQNKLHWVIKLPAAGWCLSCGGVAAGGCSPRAHSNQLK